MQAIFFYLSLPFLYLLSLLPFPLLYLFSDAVFFLLYHIIGYRRKVTAQNIRNSFPEKSEQELKILEKKFYRYFCDLFLETFKTLTISRASMLWHCRLNEETVKLFDKYYAEGRSVIVVLGHLGNWEWGGNAFSIQCRHRLFVIYHPLANKYFDRLIYNMRSRFGTGLIQMNHAYRDMVSNKKIISATAFIADQTPSPENAYWTQFLNQETPVFKGTEKISRKLNYPVIFVDVKRTARGRYEVFAELLCENPAATSEGEISEMHTRKLEEVILEQPETWLWTHRRWKHRKPD